jgi:hypothetical protein
MMFISIRGVRLVKHRARVAPKSFVLGKKILVKRGFGLVGRRFIFLV